MSSLFRSSATSSFPKKEFYKYYLRKRRKWPLSPYKTKWLQIFSEQQAMLALKRSAKTVTTPSAAAAHLLSSLIDAFAAYNCDPTPNAYHFLFKTLARRPSTWDQIPQVLDRLEKVETFETPESIFVDLITFYGEHALIEDALTLFSRMPSFRCTPTVLSLNALLSVLSKNKEGLLIVPQIILKTQQLNIRIDESSLSVLIKALCRMRKVNHAFELLNCMLLSDELTLDEKICSLVLSTACKEEELPSGEVLNFMDKMRYFGFSPGRADWCNVIRFLVKKKKGFDAYDAMNQMKLDGIKPDVVCYTMVLEGVILEGDYPKADELFDEMLVLGLVPDTCTYNVYINGLCKQNKIEEGCKLLACMEELGCRPNFITYNTLLAAFMEVGNLCRAREVVRETRLKGLGLNLRTYSIMIDGLCRNGEIDEACSLLDEMVNNCLIPKSSTLDEIVCRLCQKGLACRALELLGRMVQKNVAPGLRTWEALFLGFSIGSSFKGPL